MLKKICLYAVCTIISLLILFYDSCGVFAAGKLAPSDFVHAQGRDVIGTDGEKLIIKGMALGNSVFGYPKIPNACHHDESTYKELSEMGFNSVRFYINYQLFEDDSKPYKYKKSGFDWIDKNVKWAKKYNMGIIINMHCPQGGYQSSGGGTALWTDKACQKRLTSLWKAIAERYADEPTIWGYGLVNEPNVPMLDTIDKTVSQYYNYIRTLIKEIRKVSPYQAIFMEGISGIRDASGNSCADWEWFVPENTFEIIDDSNIIYEFHSYAPFYFTHQNAPWAGLEGVHMTYPANEICKVDYENGWVGCKYATPKSSKDGWSYFETQPLSLTSSYNIAFPAVEARGTESGAAYFDNISVVEISPDKKEQTIFFYDFESGNTVGFYQWSIDGTGEMSVSDNGINGGKCIKLSGTNTDLTASGRHFALREGYSYKVTGYAKRENMSANPAVRIDYAKASNYYTLDKNYLETELEHYIDFSKKYNVPIYLGEFGVIADGFKENRNGANWVSDMIDICLKNNIGFNYHAYHETNFGLYISDDSALPDENDKNKELEKVFKNKLVQQK